MITRATLSSVNQGLPKYRSMLAGNTAYSPTGYFSISTVTLGSTSATVTFSSIPSTYKHLQLRCFYSNTSGDVDKIQFNGDTAGNYAVNRFTAMGNSPGAQSLTSQTGIYIDRYSSDGTNYANMKTQAIIDIHDYASTNKYKTMRSTYGHVNAGGGYAGVNGGLWNNTAAISSIEFSTAGGPFTAGSIFALYGIM